MCWLKIGLNGKQSIHTECICKVFLLNLFFCALSSGLLERKNNHIDYIFVGLSPLWILIWVTRLPSVRFYSAVCLHMHLHRRCLRCSKFTLLAFVWLHSTVFSHMALKLTKLSADILALNAFERLLFIVPFCMSWWKACSQKLHMCDFSLLWIFICVFKELEWDVQ